MSGVRLDLLARDVRVRRAELHVGVRDVARRVGCSAATVSRVENGFAPDLETFAKLCRWLSAEPATYLGLRKRGAK